MKEIETYLQLHSESYTGLKVDGTPVALRKRLFNNVSTRLKILKCTARSGAKVSAFALV
jgi:hypothetical protein